MEFKNLTISMCAFGILNKGLTKKKKKKSRKEQGQKKELERQLFEMET